MFTDQSADLRPIHTSPEKALQLERSIVARFSDPAVSHALQFWKTDQCLVAPVSLKRQTMYDQACAEMSASGWPVMVRKTGGGVTPQGPGILNVALAYALDPTECPTIAGVYHMFCSPLLKLLDNVGYIARTSSVPDCFCDGAFNIVVGEQKVMGTAQYWTRVNTPVSRQIVFVHALMLINANLKSGIDAINRLHRACGIKLCVKSNAHINLQELAEKRGKPLDEQEIVQHLSALYLDELAALTG